MEIYNALFRELNPNDLLLTGNKRLIPFLHKAYAHYQQKQKKQRWLPLKIFTFTRWLETLWEKQFIEQMGFPLRLLNKLQEYSAWHIVIQSSHSFFLDIANTAQNAQKAWHLIQQTQLDYLSPFFKQCNETEAWQTWAKQFVNYCESHAYIDLSSALNHLMCLFHKKILKPPQRIFLIGFNEINPQYKNLLRVLNDQGCSIHHYAPTYPKTKQYRISLPDKETEYQTMALWAYQSFQQSKKNIGCLIPHLVERRTHLLTIFTDIFTECAPHSIDPPPFNIAAGNPLLEFGLIQTALLILDLKTINTFSSLHSLLRSPYIGGFQREQSPRASLDIFLRSAENRLGLNQLITISEEQTCFILSRSLKTLLGLIKKYTCHFLAKPSFWSAYFVKKLHAFSWPGDRPFIREEYQLLDCWSELLTAFAGLDFILGEISHDTALQHLRCHIANTLFQMKTLHDNPPIQVLGLLDAAGMYFDELWVMGFDDKTWPAPAKPNPFIPYALQRGQPIPSSSSEREYYFAAMLTKNLTAHAKKLIFSTAKQHLDETLRPSVFIQSLPEIKLNDLHLPPYSTMAKKIMESQEWEYYSDECIALTEDNFISGTQLLQSQAACPFQAFARWRLKARTHPFFPQNNGLDARERGILFHRVLEQFWNKIKNQETLLSLTQHALNQHIHDAINTCLKIWSRKRPIIFKTYFATLERQRLSSLLSTLIDLEKQRPHFSDTQHEKKQHLKLGPFILSLRIDRIDKLDGNDAMIIDYKTSRPRKIDWLDERCDYPQLPLYCLSNPKTVRSFSVWYCHRNRITLKGLSEEETSLKPLTPLKKLKTSHALHHWSDLLKHWQLSLEKLALEFQQGVNHIHPKRGATTCRQCDLQLLCRVNHPRLVPLNDETNL
ncbi:hypothetical protein BEV13_04470 [Rickettsiella grylli]|uniref:PD-(D/E)XK nuclease family protein n=1 Tax=Rickettsiella grylli TaxID=59196 RepID=UPI0008FD6A0A|nr:PD-(D/E)XK nuclease family protein [Rickettsiella grylli]OJA00099.1 hypothetical protein BEV13_04470 [Rickettsiella grylli]